MRRGVIVVFLVLLIIGLTIPANPSPIARGIESPFNTFELSADGAESPASIYSFGETLSSDTMFYPDVFLNSTAHVADDGEDDYADSKVLDDTYWSIAAVNREIANYTHTATNGLQIEGFDYAFKGWGTAGYLQIFDGSTYQNLEAVTTNTWYNGTHWGDILNSVNVTLAIYSTSGFGTCQADYIEINWQYMTLTDAEHFGESFSDVSDWSTTGETPTTDGDVCEIPHPGDSNWDTIESDSPSISSTSTYIEIRIKVNQSGGNPNLIVYIDEQDDWSGATSSPFGYWAPTTSWVTRKALVSQSVESIRINTYATSGLGFEVDYLRISPANESGGYQHDGSTTVGTIEVGAMSVSSDGDVLHCVGTGSSYSSVDWKIDNTATETDLLKADYPFIKFRWKADVGQDMRVSLYNETDQSKYIYLTETGDWVTTILNLEAFLPDGSYCSKFRMRDGKDNDQDFYVDYVKFYSIANFTVTQSGATTDDYLYVSDGILYSNVDDGYIEANHDPALSVSDTYPVYNLTTSGTAPEFSQYVSSWSSYSDDTRGATTSGTITDIKLKFDSTEIISAIKFIEDGTAPEVVRSSSTPNDPEDDETITLSAVITDAIEVYKVYFDAIVYPAGFSDTAYYATESSDNFWYYEFSSLQNGYYCFKIQATDGANTNALTEYAYLTLNVREAAIKLEPINQEGAEPDATHYQVSFESNVAGDWSVTEWTESDTSDAAETNTGVVVEGWNNIAWEKLDTDSSIVYFNMTVTSGALSTTIPGLYLVAQTTFYVEYYNHNGPDWSEYVTITGRITKTASYTVYIDDVEATTGTITSLDFDIEFSKILTSATREAWHDWGIKFTNGSQSCWANGTLYLWKNSPDQPELGGGDLGADERRTIQMWATIAAVIGVIGVGCIGLVYFKFDEIKKLQLPNYPTQPSTREERRRQRSE